MKPLSHNMRIQLTSLKHSPILMKSVSSDMSKPGLPPATMRTHTTLCFSIATHSHLYFIGLWPLGLDQAVSLQKSWLLCGILGLIQSGRRHIADTPYTRGLLK